MRQQHWLRAWKKGTWLKRLSGLTCEPSTLASGVVWWTLLLGVTPVSHSATPVREPGLRTHAISGPMSSGSTRSQEPGSSSVRTSGATSPRASIKSWKTLPKWGAMSGGECSPLEDWELLTSGSGCSSWPTPTVGDSKRSGAAGYSTESGRHSGITLTDQADRLAPKTLGDGCPPSFGQLNPLFVEALMGLPLGWTASEPLATQSIQTWPVRHSNG